MADYIKPVVFKVNDQSFGVDINLVQSIEKDVEVVRVPNAMDYISGIVNLRGEVIPAFSLAKKFGIEGATHNSVQDSTIIVNIPGMIKLAIEVDEVLEIGDIDPNKIVPMPMIARTDETKYLDRVANVNGKLIILLDIVKILTDEEAEKVKEFTEELNNN